MDIPELWKALLSGEYDLVNQMILRGANVNEPTETEHDRLTTLLHYALYKKIDVQCIRVLANLGANFNARDSKNRTPLHWAASCCVGPDVVEVLIHEGAVVDAWDGDQYTPLHYAIIKDNNIELVRKLLAEGAFIEAVNMEGMSVLHEAVRFHNVEMVKMLIRCGVNIDIKDNFGNTPLLSYFSKVEEEHKPEIIELLLDNGADVNSKSDETEFCLLLAAEFNLVPSVHLLLKRGARVNEATDMGDTALHVACENRLYEVADLLLEFGADLNAQNHEGKTPFELLPDTPSSEITAQMIISHAVKREALGQSTCEAYKEMAQSCESYWLFDQDCREEIKRMQSEKFGAKDSAISFFDILSISEDKLTALARNEEIVTAFESSGYNTSYKIYVCDLTNKFEEAKKRANLAAPIVRKLAGYIKYGCMYNRK